MKTKTIRESVTFKKAKPNEVYELLMDSKKHSMLTGSKAVISKNIGGSFSVYDGDLTGKNIEIIPNYKVVQTWRINEWKPQDHYSTVTFILKKIRNGTKLTVVHENVPGYDYKELKRDWKEFYFEPMKEMLGET